MMIRTICISGLLTLGVSMAAHAQSNESSSKKPEPTEKNIERKVRTVEKSEPAVKPGTEQQQAKVKARREAQRRQHTKTRKANYDRHNKRQTEATRRKESAGEVKRKPNTK